MKCEFLISNWKEFFIDLATNVGGDQNVCQPFWDQASCVPPTLANTTAVFPCMRMFNSKPYPSCVNASRVCLDDGTWDTHTDYTQCMIL